MKSPPRRKVGRPPKANKEEPKVTPAKRGRKPAGAASASSAQSAPSSSVTPKKRGRPPTRPRPPETGSDESSSSSESSSISSFSPHGKVTTPKQRKVGQAPSSLSTKRGINTGRVGRPPTNKEPSKRVGRPPSLNKRMVAKRKKKNSSSSPDSGWFF